jgi:ethanolamine ammonia-lyase small subunit
VVLTPNGRVALSDEVGELLGARAAAIIVGERPGLSAADSLGIYLTYGPRPGTTDAQRNCISNVRPPEGLGYEAAAAKLGYLAAEALRRGVSGVALKDEGGAGGGSRLSTGAVPIADSLFPIAPSPELLRR